MAKGRERISSRLKGLAVAIDSLSCDPANARLHDERSIEAIKASLRRFGQQKPVVADAHGVVVAGNGTLEAARQLGWRRIAAVTSDLDGVDRVGYAIADNRTAELSAWDADALRSLVAAMPEDLAGDLGWSPEELEELISGADEGGQAEEDEAPEPLPEPVSRTGDLWLLGEHRLLCGDSTADGSIERLLAGASADLVVTDPPYGIDYEGNASKRRRAIANDGADGLEELLRSALSAAAAACRPGAVWYVSAPAGPQFAAFAAVLGELGIWRQTLVWVKHSMVMGRSDYHYRHEAVFYGWLPGAPHRRPRERTRDSVLEFDRPQASPDHPTTKPVALWADLVAASSARGHVVLDPFLGSGTTVVACEQLGRRAAGVELDPIYADVAVRRWQALTGQAATLEGDGRTWEEISRERLPDAAVEPT